MPGLHLGKDLLGGSQLASLRARYALTDSGACLLWTIVLAGRQRTRAGRHRTTLEDDLLAVVTLLAPDAPLPARHRDQPLIGDWQDYWDCHIRPDLILIYRNPDATTLELVRLGSHSALGI